MEARSLRSFQSCPTAARCMLLKFMLLLQAASSLGSFPSVVYLSSSKSLNRSKSPRPNTLPIHTYCRAIDFWGLGVPPMSFSSFFVHHDQCNLRYDSCCFFRRSWNPRRNFLDTQHGNAIFRSSFEFFGRFVGAVVIQFSTYSSVCRDHVFRTCSATYASYCL